jgi:hypothetical protein
MAYSVTCCGLTPWLMKSLILRTILIMKRENVPTYLVRNQLKSYWIKTI